MGFEFSAVAAGLPMAASFAMAGGFVAFRETRRRVSLNAAMHELRRPLQALTLLLSSDPAPGRPAEDTLEMAVAAVERLDREINGYARLTERHRFCVRPIAEAATERWRPAASRAGRSLSLVWTGDDAGVEGDPIALAQAVDNLISNALQHGSGTIALKGETGGGLLRLSVEDEGGARARGRSQVRLPGRLGGRRRHGHGLRIVRRVAAQHGGGFGLVRSRGGTRADLVLPSGGGRR